MQLDELLRYWGVMIGVLAVFGISIALLWQYFAGKRELELTRALVNLYIDHNNREIAEGSELQSGKKVKKASQYYGLSVLGVYVQRRSKETRNALVLLLAIACILLIARIYDLVTVSWVPILIIFAFVVLVWANDGIFRYRVRAGYYGTNRREAFDLIRFIERESDKIDFTDGGSPKKIVSDEDLAEIKQEIASSLGHLLPAH